MPRHFISLVVVLTITSHSALADSFTWIGGTNLNWGTASNWQPNQVPGVDVVGADAIILSANGTVTNGGAPMINLGTLQSFAPVSFSNGVATMQGCIANSLSLSN